MYIFKIPQFLFQGLFVFTSERKKFGDMRSFYETASNSSIKSDRDVRSTVASNN